MATESVTERSARLRKERIAALRKKRMSAQARAAAAKPNTPRIIKAKAAQNASREKTKSRVASAMESLGNINAKGLRNARDAAEGVLVSNVPRADRQQRLKGIKKAAKAGTLAQSPDVYIPSTSAKKDADEYGEAFASPDADKMYKLSEKNRRTDMNMLERAFDSIKVAGDRATADRKKRGLSNYDMNEDVFGSRLGGGIKKTMNNKQPSTRKRAAQRGFGVETRGN
jgi:hypothetical protein